MEDICAGSDGRAEYGRCTMSYRKKEEYLKVLEEQIRCKKARSQVVEEIRGHMEEQEAFYLSEE